MKILITCIALCISAIAILFGLPIDPDQSTDEGQLKLQQPTSAIAKVQVAKEQDTDVTAQLTATQLMAEQSQSGLISLPEMVNSDEEPATKNVAATSEDEILANYVNSGNPQQVMDMYAERRRARAMLIQEQMNSQNMDPRWSQDLTEKFAQANQLLPNVSGLVLDEADCRESLCALHLAFDTANEYQRMAPLLSSVGLVLGYESWVHHDAKPQGAILYLAKENQTLPDVELVTEG